MIAKQLSVFLENRSGRLDDVLNTLTSNGINMTALSLADTSDYGMLRLVVSDAEKAEAALKAEGFSASITEVIFLEIGNEVGSLNRAMEGLLQAGISIEYMYAFSKGSEAIAVLKCSDADVAVEILGKKQ